MFLTSEEHRDQEVLQRLVNRGLFYTLTIKKTGEIVGHYNTLTDAMRAKTRKTRVVLTRNLLIKKA